MATPLRGERREERRECESARVRECEREEVKRIRRAGEEQRREREGG